jgi:hypothetical protein
MFWLRFLFRGLQLVWILYFLTILTWNCGQQVPDFLFLLASRILVEYTVLQSVANVQENGPGKVTTTR